MGIPKFYRWLSERYPLLNQKLTLTEGPPEIDNLYLDMNGIIHNCTHANRKDIGGVTEEDMMLKVFDYLEKLVQIVRPQKLLFMAIDGVAPRAKMNQQRSRRFKSAMERLKNEEEQRRKGEAVPEDPFDSNCITPGTEFMARLGKHLRFFIRRKMAEDPLWQKPTVVFSGHEVPGEGEHKIMEYIRWEKRQSNYQPNQRHCMYGLDADLIMLSLVSHEPHFCLLREVVSYTGNNRGQPAREVLENPCADNFILFQIGLLREYFELEYGNIKLPFPFDLERIVDDYVLMCMLVGNDFLPALPTLDIAEGALNKLMQLYKELLPSLGGYLTHAGDLDRRRLELLLERIGQMELETLEERAQDAEYFESKRAKRAARMGGPRSQLDEIDVGMQSLALASANSSRFTPLNEPLEPASGPGPGTTQQQQGPTMMSREARQMMMAGLGGQGLQMWKDRYYNEKLEAYGAEDRRMVAEHYIAGLHWVLEYYYRGVASWDWYYPYHYAPMASDLVDLDAIQVAFAQGTPFRPFEQLLAVLPAASSKLLPPPFRAMMMDPESPIIDFYPPTFQVDMEGKRADWEGVVLVPFVDEVRLLEAAKSVKAAVLSAEELARNKLGQIQIFQYSRNTSEAQYCTSTMPKHFRDLKVCHSRCIEKSPPPPLPSGGKGFVPALVPGTCLGLNTPPGMPTLKSLQVRPALRNIGVNVLGTPSRRESLVLGFKDLREALNGAVLSAEQVATSGLLGSRAYINWPYLQEARVVRVSDRNGQVSYDSKGAVKVQRWQGQEVQRWEMDAANLVSNFMSRCGIDVGKVDLVVGVKVCLGYVRHSDGTIEKTYSKDEVQVPLQAVIMHRPQQATAGASPVADDVPGFPTLFEGMKVVFLGMHFFGCMATVLPDLGKGLSKHGKPSKQGAAAANGHYRVLVQPVSDQAGAQALRSAKRVVERFAVRYYNSGEVSGKVGITPRLLGRITGNMWARDGDDRYDLGLAIKTSSRDVCVPGFSHPIEGGNGWTYSAAVINILQNYSKMFPWLWAALLKSEGENSGPGDLRLEQMLPGLTPGQRKDKVREVTDWIKSTPLAKRPLVKLGTQVLSDEAVKALQSVVTPVPARPPPPTEYENVPSLLLLPPYTPGADQVKLAVQGGPFQLGDRVVCVSGKGTPPYGLRGTVIGVYEEACEVLFDEDFGGGSNLNGRINGKCGAYVPADLLLCVNKAVEISLAKHQVPRQSKQQAPAAPLSAAPDGTYCAAEGRNGQAPAKQAADATSCSAQKAVQPRASQAATRGPCVPASVAVTAPVSPPVPSRKLLGAAMRAGGAVEADRQQQQPTQPQSVAPAGAAAAGNALLQKLATGAQNHGQPAPARAEDNAAVRAVAAAAAALASMAAVQQPMPGSLAQLQKLVPNARMGSATAAQQGPPPSAPAPRPAAQQVLQQQHVQPQFALPPMMQMAHPPQHMLMHGGVPPLPMGMFSNRAPYVTGPSKQSFLKPYTAPPAPSGAMPMGDPFPSGVIVPQGPAPMAMLMGAGPYNMPHAVATLPAQPAFTQPPVTGFQLARAQDQRQAAPVQVPSDGNPSNGARKAVQVNGAAPASLSLSRVADAGTSARGTAPSSHPIDVDTLQRMDNIEEAVFAHQQAGVAGPALRKSASQVAPNGAAARSSARAPGSAAEDESCSAGGGFAFGKSARLPDASGRGFRGRGRPVPAAEAQGPAAPGSQNAAQSTAVAAAPPAAAARFSLDSGPAGRSPAAPLAPAAGSAAVGIPTVAAPPPPNPGAALLRRLQSSSARGSADDVSKTQSLDSGTELRALQRS